MQIISYVLLALGAASSVAAFPAAIENAPLPAEIVARTPILPAGVTIKEAIVILAAYIAENDHTAEIHLDPAVASAVVWGQTTRGSVADTTNLKVDIVSDAQAAAAAAKVVKRETAVAAVDRLCFSTSIANFLYYKSKQTPAGLNWTDDGCSSSPDMPLGFNFLNSYARPIYCVLPVGPEHVLTRKIGASATTLDTATSRRRTGSARPTDSRLTTDSTRTCTACAARTVASRWLRASAWPMSTTLL